MQEITLYQAPTRPWNTPNLSPFCAKLECYLRITEIPHKVAPMSRSKAPKGKIPYIDLGNGTLLGDSQLIIEELEKRLASEGKPALDAGMSAQDAATAHLIRRAIEEGFYHVGVYLRWTQDDGYAVIRDEFKKFVPGFVVPLVRRDIRKRLHGQGTGRHALDEVSNVGARDLEAVSALLGDKPFLFGDKPRVVDCTVYAFLEAILGFPVDSVVKQRAAAKQNLVDYRTRFRERWWKDLVAKQGK